MVASGKSIACLRLSHSPWGFLLNHMMAKKGEHSQLRKYLGRELMQDETGVVPDIHQN